MANDKLIRVFQKPFRLAELTEAILQALEPDIPDGTLKGISASGISPVKDRPADKQGTDGPDYGSGAANG